MFVGSGGIVLCWWPREDDKQACEPCVVSSGTWKVPFHSVQRDLDWSFLDLREEWGEVVPARKPLGTRVGCDGACSDSLWVGEAGATVTAAASRLTPQRRLLCHFRWLWALRGVAAVGQVQATRPGLPSLF